MLEEEYDLDAPPQTPMTPMSGDDDEKEHKKVVFKFAKITFDTQAAMDTFVEALNDQKGLYIRANKISLGHSGLVCTVRVYTMYKAIMFRWLIVYRNRSHGTCGGCMMAR